MTSKMVNCYRENLTKYEAVKKLYEEFRTLENIQNETVIKIGKYYNIIFKDFSEKKPPIQLSNRKEYILSNSGILIKKAHLINGVNIFNGAIPNVNSFLDELIAISKEKNKFKIFLSKAKYRIIDNFLKKTELLKVKDIISLELDGKEIDLLHPETHRPNKVYLRKMNLNSYIINLYFSVLKGNFFNEGTLQITLHSTNPGFDSLAYLEQVYPEVLKLFKQAIKQRKKEISNLNRFIEYLKTKFENELVLAELYYTAGAPK